MCPLRQAQGDKNICNSIKYDCHPEERGKPMGGLKWGEFNFLELGYPFRGYYLTTKTRERTRKIQATDSTDMHGCPQGGF